MVRTCVVDDMSPEPPAPTASVLLCVRNGGTLLERQLASLGAQDYSGAWELVLVNNGSADDTRAVAGRWAGRVPRLRIIDEAHRGLNRARNAGVRHARAPLVACCDADDQVAHGWLTAMVEALQRFDVVGGPLEVYRLNPPGSPREAVPQRGALPTVFGRPYVMGANLGFRKDVWKRISGFDGQFMLGSDDTDFCLRAQYAGCSVGFAPDAVVHYRVRSTARAVMRQRYAYGRGHQLLVEKHDQLGAIESRLVQRWKVVVVAAGILVRHVPLLFDPDQRLQYVASAAYLAGRIDELARETVAALRGSAS